MDNGFFVLFYKLPWLFKLLMKWQSQQGQLLELIGFVLPITLQAKRCGKQVLYMFICARNLSLSLVNIFIIFDIHIEIKNELFCNYF